MVDYSIMMPEGILVLKPQAPLRKEDFDGLSALVDSYLSEHTKLHGVLIQAKDFPGWENFGGFTAHMHFVRPPRESERIAMVTDSSVAGLAETLGKHFTAAEIRRFHFSDGVRALGGPGNADDAGVIDQNSPSYLPSE